MLVSRLWSVYSIRISVILKTAAPWKHCLKNGLYPSVQFAENIAPCNPGPPSHVEPTLALGDHLHTHLVVWRL